MMTRLALAALPLALLVGCSSSHDDTASTPIATTSAVSSSSAAAPSSSSAAMTSSTAPTSSTTASSTTATATSSTSWVGPTPSTTKPSATSPGAPPSTTSPRATATSRRATPTAAKTADCTNLGTGKHYPCTQQEYDAINEADEPSYLTYEDALPTALTCLGFERAVRPDSLLIMCGDGGEGLSDITWSSWTTKSATGTGTHFERVCEPNCAQGHDITTPVRIRLSAPVTTSSGPQFSTMTVTGQRVHTIRLITAG